MTERRLPHGPDVTVTSHDEVRKYHAIEVSILLNKLISQANPDLTDQQVDERIRGIGGDSDFSAESKKNAQDTDTRHLRDARSIAHFYMANPEVKVPTNVVILDSQNYKSVISQDDEDKALILVDEGINGSRSNSSIDYSDYKTAPDIFLKSIDPSVGFAKKRDFAISGCDVLMIGLIDIRREKMKKLSLSSKNKIVVMEGTYLIGKAEETLDDHVFDVSLSTDGDIIQSKDTNLSTQEIQCNNFIQEGGYISRSNVVCRGKYFGGIQYRKSAGEYVKVTEDYGTPFERSGHPLTLYPETADTVAADTDASQASRVLSLEKNDEQTELGAVINDESSINFAKKESHVMLAELAEAFNKLKEPDTCLIRADDSGPMEIRGYDLSMMESGKKVELATYAAAAGWKIVSSTSDMLIVQQKQKTSNQD